MFRNWYTTRAVMVRLVVVGLLGVAGPAVSAEAVAPTSGVRHEYRLIFAGDAGSGQVVIPQPPAGASYVKWDMIGVDTSGQWSGALLRSDGRMVGFGPQGLEAVAVIDREFPNARIVDFTGLRVAGAYLIFADGTVHQTAALGRETGYFNVPGGRIWKGGLAGPWDMPSSCSPVIRDGFVKFLPGLPGDNSMRLLRTDGRGVVFRSSEESGAGCSMSRRDGYVDGFTTGLRSDEEDSELTVMLRRDGGVDLYANMVLIVTKGSAKEALADADEGGPFATMFVPKLPKGVRYVDAASSSRDMVAYLRSDGRVVYRTDSSGTVAVKQQPPKLPVGLKYVSLDAWWGSWILMRSDGQAVVLNGGYTTLAGSPAQRVYHPHRLLPNLAKGWRYVSGAIPRNRETVFLVERIPAGEKAATGIEKVKAPKSVRRGKAVKVTVKVASRAVLDGGLVKATYKGKTIGKARVKGTKAVIKLKTKAMKPKGKNTIGVQYLGNYQAKKSVKAKAVLITG